jgi:hypothetical protein
MRMRCCTQPTKSNIKGWDNLFPNIKINEVLHGPRFLAPGRISDLAVDNDFTNVLP